MIVQCIECGKDFDRKKRPRCLLCSDECGRRRRLRSNREAQWARRHGEPRLCVVCGGVLPVRRGGLIVCSDECRRIRTREKKREFREQHRDLANQWIREWRKTENGRAYTQRKQARRRSARERLVQETWKRLEVAERDNWECYLCGDHISEPDLNIDHVIPLCRGGDDAPWNVAATHAACNLSKGSSLPRVAWEKALELRREDTAWMTSEDSVRSPATVTG